MTSRCDLKAMVADSRRSGNPEYTTSESYIRTGSRRDFQTCERRNISSIVWRCSTLGSARAAIALIALVTTIATVGGTVGGTVGVGASSPPQDTGDKDALQAPGERGADGRELSPAPLGLGRLPDLQATAGFLFQHRLGYGPLAAPLTSYKVSEAGTHALPIWLAFDGIAFFGVPLPRDAGRVYYISVQVSPGPANPPGDDAAPLAEEIFALEVVPATEETYPCGGGGCSAGAAAPLLANMLLQVDFGSLGAMQRVLVFREVGKLLEGTADPSCLFLRPLDSSRHEIAVLWSSLKVGVSPSTSAVVAFVVAGCGSFEPDANGDHWRVLAGLERSLEEARGGIVVQDSRSVVSLEYPLWFVTRGSALSMQARAKGRGRRQAQVVQINADMVTNTTYDATATTEIPISFASSYEYDFPSASYEIFPTETVATEASVETSAKTTASFVRPQTHIVPSSEASLVFLTASPTLTGSTSGPDDFENLTTSFMMSNESEAVTSFQLDLTSVEVVSSGYSIFLPSIEIITTSAYSVPASSSTRSTLAGSILPTALPSPATELVAATELSSPVQLPSSPSMSGPHPATAARDISSPPATVVTTSVPSVAPLPSSAIPTYTTVYIEPTQSQLLMASTSFQPSSLTDLTSMFTLSQPFKTVSQSAESETIATVGSQSLSPSLQLIPSASLEFSLSSATPSPVLTPLSTPTTELQITPTSSLSSVSTVVLESSVLSLTPFSTQEPESTATSFAPSSIFTVVLESSSIQAIEPKSSSLLSLIPSSTPQKLELTSTLSTGLEPFSTSPSSLTQFSTPSSTGLESLSLTQSYEITLITGPKTTLPPTARLESSSSVPAFLTTTFELELSSTTFELEPSSTQTLMFTPISTPSIELQLSSTSLSISFSITSVGINSSSVTLPSIQSMPTVEHASLTPSLTFSALSLTQPSMLYFEPTPTVIPLPFNASSVSVATSTEQTVILSLSPFLSSSSATTIAQLTPSPSSMFSFPNSVESPLPQSPVSLLATPLLQPTSNLTTAEPAFTQLPSISVTFTSALVPATMVPELSTAAATIHPKSSSSVLHLPSLSTPTPSLSTPTPSLSTPTPSLSTPTPSVKQSSNSITFSLESHMTSTYLPQYSFVMSSTPLGEPTVTLLTSAATPTLSLFPTSSLISLPALSSPEFLPTSSPIPLSESSSIPSPISSSTSISSSIPSSTPSSIVLFTTSIPSPSLSSISLPSFELTSSPLFSVSSSFTLQTFITPPLSPTLSTSSNSPASSISPTPSPSPLLCPYTNVPPVSAVPIGIILVNEGQLFQYQISNNAFNDTEPGNLTLALLDTNGNTLPNTTWVQLRGHTLEGIALRDRVLMNAITDHVLVVRATDSCGKNAYNFVTIRVAPQASRVNFIAVYVEGDILFFNQSLSVKISLVQRLAGFGQPSDPSTIYVAEFREGSIGVVYTNLSISDFDCEAFRNWTASIYTDVGNYSESFRRAVLPFMTSNTRGASLEGPCALASFNITPTLGYASPNVSSPSSASQVLQLLETVLPIAVAAFLLLVAGIVCCLLYRQHRSERKLLRGARSAYTDRHPVYLNGELSFPVRRRGPLFLQGEELGSRPLLMGAGATARDPADYVDGMRVADLFDEDDDELANVELMFASRPGRVRGDTAPPYRLPPVCIDRGDLTAGELALHDSANDNDHLLHAGDGGSVSAGQDISSEDEGRRSPPKYALPDCVRR